MFMCGKKQKNKNKNITRKKYKREQQICQQMKSTYYKI